MGSALARHNVINGTEGIGASQFVAGAELGEFERWDGCVNSRPAGNSDSPATKHHEPKGPSMNIAWVRPLRARTNSVYFATELVFG